MSLEAALARCSVPRFKWQWNGSVDAVMSADSGVPCNIKLREGSGTIIKRITLSTRPAAGTVAPPNPVNVTYRSRAGFQGEDRFVFNIVATKNGEPVIAKIAVAVSVGGSGVLPTSASPSHVPSSKKSAGRAAPANTSVARCMQQAGGSIDPVTKRWTFYATERDGMGRLDMYRMCLAGGDRAKANTVPVRERALNPGGTAPSRY
jgi:hypothetical protein